MPQPPLLTRRGIGVLQTTDYFVYRRRPWPIHGCPLRDDFLDHFACGIRQPEIPATVLIRELRVIDAKQIQDRGVEIMHVRFLLDGLVPELIRRAVSHAAFNAAPGQPY